MSEVKYVLVSMWDLDNKELAMNSSVAISLMSIKQEFKTVDINCALIVPLARFFATFSILLLRIFLLIEKSEFSNYFCSKLLLKLTKIWGSKLTLFLTATSDPPRFFMKFAQLTKDGAKVAKF